MTLVTSIEPRHVAAVLGQPAPVATSVTDEQWRLWINDALMFIQDRADRIGVASEDIDQAKLDYVIREVVADQVRRRDTDVPDGEFYDGPKFRTVADWYPLLGLMGGQGGAFSIDMIGASGYHLPWCSYSLGALYCSCGVDIAGTPIYEWGDV